MPEVYDFHPSFGTDELEEMMHANGAEVSAALALCRFCHLNEQPRHTHLQAKGRDHRIGRDRTFSPAIVPGDVGRCPKCQSDAAVALRQIVGSVSDTDTTQSCVFGRGANDSECCHTRVACSVGHVVCFCCVQRWAEDYVRQNKSKADMELAASWLAVPQNEEPSDFIPPCPKCVLQTRCGHAAEGGRPPFGTFSESAMSVLGEALLDELRRIHGLVRGALLRDRLLVSTQRGQRADTT